MNIYIFKIWEKCIMFLNLYFIGNASVFFFFYIMFLKFLHADYSNSVFSLNNGGWVENYDIV